MLNVFGQGNTCFIVIALLDMKFCFHDWLCDSLLKDYLALDWRWDLRSFPSFKCITNRVIFVEQILFGISIRESTYILMY